MSRESRWLLVWVLSNIVFGLSNRSFSANSFAILPYQVNVLFISLAAIIFIFKSTLSKYHASFIASLLVAIKVMVLEIHTLSVFPIIGRLMDILILVGVILYVIFVFYDGIIYGKARWKIIPVITSIVTLVFLFNRLAGRDLLFLDAMVLFMSFWTIIVAEHAGLNLNGKRAVTLWFGYQFMYVSLGALG